MIDPDTADDQAAALETAADTSPIRQVRNELRRRAAEWRRAVADLMDAGPDEYEIDIAGAVAPGDRLLVFVASPYSEDKDREAAPVLRVLHRDGQTTIHCTPDTSGRDLYLNFAGPTSPVVVRR